MYEEILNIIYIYAIDYKLPDKKFVESIVNIIANHDNLNDYIKDIDYKYEAKASYNYVSKILSFNNNNLIEDIEKTFKIYSGIYDLGKINSFDKYIFICIKFTEAILHELEHTRQIKVLETTCKDNFETNLIKNNIDILSLNPKLYKKEHNLFLIERMANIKSSIRVIEMLKLDSSFPTFNLDIFNNRYNYFIRENYKYFPLSKYEYYPLFKYEYYPLLKYVKTVGTSIYYDDILINIENSKKILKKVKKDISFEDRLLMGLPITTKEFIKIKNK